MRNKIKGISFCIGVYNEEEILEKYLKKIQTGLEKIVNKNYEIVVVENASTDRTRDILKKNVNKHIKAVFTPRKGLGLAYRLAVQNAKYDHIVLSAIDLPFGFSDLENALPIWEKYDVLYGSHAHPKSQVYIPFKRKTASLIYNTLLRIAFGVRIKHTQGSVFFRKSKIMPVLKHCQSKNAFYTAQITIYGQLYGLKIKEIQVKHDLKNIRVRQSKYSIIKDGKDMFNTIMREYPKFKSVISKKRL